MEFATWRDNDLHISPDTSSWQTIRVRSYHRRGLQWQTFQCPALKGKLVQAGTVGKLYAVPRCPECVGDVLQSCSGCCPRCCPGCKVPFRAVQAAQDSGCCAGCVQLFPQPILTADKSTLKSFSIWVYAVSQSMQVVVLSCNLAISCNINIASRFAASDPWAPWTIRSQSCSHNACRANMSHMHTLLIYCICGVFGSGIQKQVPTED